MSGCLVHAELDETVAFLRAEGIEVDIDSRGEATFAGVRGDLSPRAIVAMETIRGRERALRKVLDQAGLDADARRVLERERKSLEAEAGGQRAAAVRKPRARTGPPRRTHCQSGVHPLSGANLYETPNGRRRCRACIRLRDAKRGRASSLGRAWWQRKIHMSAPTTAALSGGTRLVLACRSSAPALEARR